MKTMINDNTAISHSTNLWTKINTVLGVASLGATCWNYLDRNKDQDVEMVKRTKQISEVLEKLDGLKGEGSDESSVEELRTQISQLIAQFQQQIASLTSANKVLEVVRTSSDGLSSTIMKEIGEVRSSLAAEVSKTQAEISDIRKIIEKIHRDIVDKSLASVSDITETQVLIRENQKQVIEKLERLTPGKIYLRP